MQSDKTEPSSKFLQTISNAQKIAIFSHINPDADALCSAFALRNIIKNNFDYIFVDVFIDGTLSDLYDPILRNEVLNPIPYSHYDLAIVLDCPTIERIGKFSDLYSKINQSINIDHHATNTRFANVINYTTSRVSSTCELLYLIAKKEGLELNNTIAKELYQGIITDTNCFTSASLTGLSHRVLNELLKFKFNAELIKKYYFKNNTLAKMKLQASAIKAIKTYNKNSIAIMKIPYSEFEKNNATFEDTLGIVDNGIAIEGIQICALLIEKEPGKIYVSLRGKGDVDVCEIAKEFNGGGSEEVAAFQYEGDLKELEKNLVAFMKAEVDPSCDKDDIKMF